MAAAIPAMLLALAVGSPAAAADAEPCQMAADDAAWTQSSFKAWEHVSRQMIRLPPNGEPRVIQFDARCGR